MHRAITAEKVKGAIKDTAGKVSRPSRSGENTCF
jgi:hypothetical protein